MPTIAQLLSAELNQPIKYIENVIALLDEGNTVPFIARYRKEHHGAMDDTTLRTLETRLGYLRGLQQRREEVLRSIEAQGRLTDELTKAVHAAATLAEVEDLYRPFKPKRRTRGTVAREKGLEPLAAAILRQDGRSPEALAKDYVNPEGGVETVEEALAGASDIIAEDLSDDPAIRKDLRSLYHRRGTFACRAADPDADSVYRLYYDFSAPLHRLQDHQILAMNRGEKEGFLKPAPVLPAGVGAAIVCHAALNPRRPSDLVRNAAVDAFDRLIEPSASRELRSELTDRAGQGAIRNFALNLRPLLMQPPVKGFVTMGLDPGYRNGCKVAVVDPTGKVLDTAVVYPTFSEGHKQKAIATLSKLMARHGVRHIAIGNGTASRETEAMTVELLKNFPNAAYAIVSEAGASVYSASELAAQEFPDFDVNLRSAVSIARRLQDPLAELVKIDPKAIGVGQYQHDCPQKELSAALDAVVEDCVNAVGVDLNTASSSLLRRVSGLTAATAKNIVTYREENGPFTSRAQIKKVPKIGPKAFQQCAGFLRVSESREILDRTGVHPESYAAAAELLKFCGYDKKDIPAGLSDLNARMEKLGIEKLSDACGVGELTLRDIARELQKPGRDPREDLPKPVLRKDVLEIKDLQKGMVLTGTVRNVIDFGAFVDIGVHQDGLVHISQISSRRLNHPSEALKVGDVVKVMVLDVDEKRKRISLTIKGVPKE